MFMQRDHATARFATSSQGSDKRHRRNMPADRSLGKRRREVASTWRRCLWGQVDVSVDAVISVNTINAPAREGQNCGLRLRSCGLTYK